MDVPVIVASLNAARDMAALLINERDRQKAAAIQVDLTQKIIEAQAQLTQVLGAIISKDAQIVVLAERVRVLEAQQSKRTRYQLAKLGTVGDVFAYRLRGEAELGERADEPPHFVCQPCLDAGKKGVLQISGHVASCPLCKVSVQIGPLPPPPRVVLRRPR